MPFPTTPNGTAVLTFPPIYNNQAVHTRTDPHGLLPWIQRIRVTKNFVLEWDNEGHCLRVFLWPCVDGQRVPPSELNALRQTHNYRNPSCLCASESLDPACFTEAAVFLVTSGRLAGEYVAACARHKCKYWIFLERLYTRRGLPIETAHPRAQGAEIPPPIEYNPFLDDSKTRSSSPASTQSSSPLGHRRSTVTHPGNLDNPARTRIRRRLNPIAYNIPCAQPAPRPTDAFGLLLLLDAHIGAGITEAEFRSIITKCSNCGMLTTAQVFNKHTCHGSGASSSAISAPDEIIDLTLSD